MTRQRLAEWRAGRCRLWLLLCGLLCLQGCAAAPNLSPQAIDQQLAQWQSRELDCPRTDPRRCASISPLESLPADREQHHLLLLDKGEDALVARVHMIRAAQQQIVLQNYVLNDDSVSRFLLEELLQAARRGVQVRILVDAFIALPDAQLQASLVTAHENLQVRLYNPMRDAAVLSDRQFFAAMFCCFRQLNHRMHNKIFAIDGRHGIVGGRNTAGRYFDLDTRMNYLDLEVLVSGPEVQTMMTSFDAYWQDSLSRPAQHTRDVAAALPEAHGQPVSDNNSRYQFVLAQAQDPDWWPQRLQQQGFVVEQLRYFSDPPGKTLRASEQADSTDLIHELIAGAEQRLVMQSPYLVLSRRFERTLAALDGVDILFSSNALAATDAFPVYAISRRERHRMVDDLGMTVFEMQPYPEAKRHLVPRYETLVAEKAAGITTPMRADTRSPTEEREGPRLSLHGKLVLIDGHTAVVTAHNLDPRSEVYNTENGIVVEDPVFTRALEDYVARIAAPGNSWISASKPQTVPLLGTLNRGLARGSRRLPTLDLWPGTLVQVYEQDPRAEDGLGESLGAYPEVRPGRRYLTGFIGRMMGFVKPLM